MNNVPRDYLLPDFELCHKVHDWKNYVSERLVVEWETLDASARALFAECLQNIADGEEGE